MKLSAFMMLFMLNACTTTHSTPAAPWSVEVATSGGIAGRSVGTYAIDSAGVVTVVSMSGKRCEFEATEAELARVERLLGDARPDEWKEAYVPQDPCCDRIEYLLTLEQKGVQRKVRWIDDPPPMPADLQALTAALMGGPESLRVRYGEQCR